MLVRLLVIPAWCPYCKRLAPEYAKAATDLKANSPAIPLAKVDATAELNLAKRFKIKGYPTVYWFVNGKLQEEYQGTRTEADIVNWVQKRIGQSVTELNSIVEIEKFKTDTKDSAVFFGSTDSQEYREFLETSTKTDNIEFAFTPDQSLRSYYNIEESGVILFKAFGERAIHYSQSSESSTLKSFINKNTFRPLKLTDEKCKLI